MDTPFHCGSAARRAAVLASNALIGPLALNGIDFVEVLDRAAPTPELRQRILQLHFLKPSGVAALTAANIVIEGGDRITAIAVTGVALLPGSDRALVFTLDRYGDFSRYTLRLLDDAGAGPPAHIDPPLSAVEFSFKTDCPTGFDCADDATCLPEVAPLQDIDTLARDYESLRRLMLDRMATTMPGWTSRNPADLGVTLVELLADAGDRAAYLQDAAATEAYLGTARKRVSVRRHARLTGFRLHEGCNARTLVVLTVGADVAASDGVGTPLPVLPRGAVFLAKLPRDAVIPPAQSADALAETAAIFEAMESVAALRQARNAIPFHLWGEALCCLPRGAVSAHLSREDATLSLAEGDLLVFEEGPGEDGTPADPRCRHAVRLSADPMAMTDHVAGHDVLAVTWHAGDALPFTLRLDAAVARGNVVLADHGLTEVRPGTALDPPESGTGLWRPALPEQAGIVHAVPYDPQAALGQPVALALRQDPADALAAATLTAAAEPWLPVRDLLAVDRFAASFVVEPEAGERPRLRFGDGQFGRRPPPRFDELRWRRGAVAAGHVGADALTHLVNPQPLLAEMLREGRRAGRFDFADDAAAEAAALGIAQDLATGVISIGNPLPGQGATPPQPTLTAKLDAPQAFRVNERAVTTADYAAAAERHPEVSRAVAEHRWMGSWQVVFLTVDRRGGLPVDAGFEAELTRFLERFRLAGHDLEIEPPRYAPLDIALWVCVAGGFVASEVERALRARFTSGLREDGQPGFFHPDRFSFGEDVALSPIIAEAMGVPGVRWVGVRRPGDAGQAPDGFFRRLREPATDYADAGAIPIAPLEVALLDNDPDRPENGRLRLMLEGGL
jgi:hypothetical protein